MTKAREATMFVRNSVRDASHYPRLHAMAHPMLKSWKNSMVYLVFTFAGGDSCSHQASHQTV